MGLGISEMSQITGIIQQRASYDFHDYSVKSLERRFLKILMDYRLSTDELMEKLDTDPAFLENVVKRITVNTTELFRDPQVWIEAVHVLLPLLAQKDEINIWHAGCSSGLEVYSMLILLCEMNLISRTHIYATDLNTDMLDVARKGNYRLRFNLKYIDSFEHVMRALPKNSDVPNNEMLRRYMEIDTASDQIRVSPVLTAIPLFEKHDLVTGSVPRPFGCFFDLIVCRNVAIYFNYNLQNRIFELFHNSLTSDGRLWMGVHESIHGQYLAKFEKMAFYYQKL